MIKSIRYIQVRVEMVHDEDITPDEVIDNCDYSFDSITIGANIIDTEILSYSETPL